jgi:cell division protein FtsL
VIKLNTVLALLLVLCALTLVTSQHKARKLFSELAQEQDAARQIDVEWGQLQLEQSTWAMHARIEKIASSRLQMHVPVSARTRLVPDEGGHAAGGSEAVADSANGARRGAHPSEPARTGIKR